LQWRHEYDTSGNLVNSDFGLGDTRKEFEAGDRVASILGSQVSILSTSIQGSMLASFV
jgi:hypothetical protein